MEPADSSSQTVKPGVKRAFLQHLPQRVAAIRESWRTLIHTDWDQERFEQLYQRIRDLGESAAKLGLVQVSESVFSLEVYLSTFGGSQSRPGIERSQAVDDLLRALEAATECAAQAGSAEEAGRLDHSPTAYCLLAGDQVVPGLDKLLRSRHWTVRSFSDPGQIQPALRQQAPDALVLDARFIRGLFPAIEEVRQLRSAGKRRLPIIFVAASNDLQRRLAAMRAGADAYFVAPVDTEALVRRLTHLVVPRDASPYRILVVEDDPSQAKFAATILRKGGMDAKVVTEALDVMNAIQGFKPDLVLMDVYMPDASGVELTRVIRQQSDLVALPIVYLSGEQNPEKQQSALSVGGDDFIAKPIRPKHLLATVSNRIQRARQLRDGLGGGQDEGRLDSATGLSTKSRFFERVDSLVRDRDQNDREGGLLHIALEGMAEIKAQIGPEQADTLVAMAGTRVASALAAGDVATRLGDSSFAVLISHAEVPQIRSLADRLLKAITHMPYEIGNRRLRLRASAGLCPLYQGLSDGAGAASRAAKATRSASQAGGDRVEVYGGEAGGETTALHRQLRDALESGDTELMLRPIGRLRNDPAESYEVGLRISTGDGRTAIDPRDVRTTAERADMAEETFRWMLDQALSVLEERGGDGRAFRLFLRLSPQFLADQETQSWLRDRLRARHLTGSGLVAELPLTDVAADPKAARELVRSLGALGIGTVLSRFTGSDAAFRVLRFLRSDYVELTEAVAQSSQQALTRLAEAVHQAGALVIVPHGTDGRREESTRAAGADLILGQRVQQAHGAYGPGS